MSKVTISKFFKSDNYSGIHEKVLQSIINSNNGHMSAYCDDEVSLECNLLFNKIFQTNSKVLYAFSGTGANVLAVKSCLKPSQAIICSSSAHINTNEPGAIESVAGVKIYPIQTNDGKISSFQIYKEYQKNTVFGKHSAMPRLVSISQPTELGTVYSLDELKAIKKTCTELNLYLHIDCCRVYNAAVSLNCSLAQTTSDIGADIISLGGTKLGCMLAEAVIIFNPSLKEESDYIQKNTLQLYSKNRFVASQYLALLQDNLWFEIAKHENDLAKSLEQNFLNKGFKINQKVQSNHVFVELDKDLAKKLQHKGWCYIWPDEKLSLIRLVTSFDNTEDDIQDLFYFINN